MKELIEYLIKNITNSDNFTVSETQVEENRYNYIVQADSSIIGLIIGKNGNVIKALRNLIKIKATLEKKLVTMSVEEKTAN